MISTSILARITNMLLHDTNLKRTSKQQLVGYKIKQEAIKTVQLTAESTTTGEYTWCGWDDFFSQQPIWYCVLYL